MRSGEAVLPGPLSRRHVSLIRKGRFRRPQRFEKADRKRRYEIAEELRENALAFAIGAVEADEIDTINILEATRKR